MVKAIASGGSQWAMPYETGATLSGGRAPTALRRQG